MSMIPGMFYIYSEDGISELGKVVEVNDLMEEESKKNSSDLLRMNEELSLSFEIGGKTAEKMALIFSGLYDAVLSACPNNRIIHLTKNARKERTKKKNLHRIFRMLEKQR